MVTKGKVLIVTMFLVFFVSIPVVNASPAGNKIAKFYVEAYTDPDETIIHWQITTDEHVIYRLTQNGFVNDESGNETGTITIDGLLTQLKGPEPPTNGTILVRFIIRFYSGVTIEGALYADITRYPGIPPQPDQIIIDGRFVGHGDMHVAGIVKNNPHYISGFALEGYSWGNKGAFGAISLAWPRYSYEFHI